LLVGRDISDAAAFRDRVKTTLVWSGLLALALGLVGGTVMSRNMLRRVEQVNRTAERVIAGNLSDRVPRLGTADEFDQLAANLNALLSIAEAEAGARREPTEAFDLAGIARAVAELYEPVAEEKGLAMRLESTPGILIRGDRHLLSQAVANLLDNALKYGAPLS